MMAANGRHPLHPSVAHASNGAFALIGQARQKMLTDTQPCVQCLYIIERQTHTPHKRVQARCWHRRPSPPQVLARSPHLPGVVYSSNRPQAHADLQGLNGPQPPLIVVMVACILVIFHNLKGEAHILKVQRHKRAAGQLLKFEHMPCVRGYCAHQESITACV
jgi:hypothetical protein